MKKIISSVLAAALMLSPFASYVCSAEEQINLTVLAGECMPVGTLSDLKLDFSGTADRIELLSSYDGTSYSVIETFDNAENFNAETEYEEYEKQLKVIAYSSDDSVVAESEPVVVTGMKEKIEKQVWNENFDGASTVPDSSDGNVLYIARDGGRVFNVDGNCLQGAAWRGGSIDIMPYSTEDTSYGDSVCMKSSSSSNTQFNALWSKVSGDTAVFEMEYLFENTYIDRPLMEYKVMNGGTESWLPHGIYLRNGRIVFNNAAQQVMTGTWYKITAIMNLESGDMSVLVNNKFLASANAGSFSQTVRMSMEGGSGNSVMWIDNYNVRQVTYSKAAEKKFNIILPENAKVYKGERLAVGADINGYRDAETVEYYTSADGKNFDIAAEKPASSPEAQIAVEDDQLYVKARLVSAEGNLLAETSAEKINVKCTVEIEKLWNVDFETNGFRIRDAGGSQGMISQVVTKSDGDDIRNKYDELLECHRGAKENVMTIESYTSSDNITSKCVRLFSPSGANANQFNKWAAKITKNIAVFSIDACLIKEAASTNLMTIQVSTESGSVDAAAVSVRSGMLVFTNDSGGAVSSILFENDKWNNIKMYVNLAERSIRCCVNGSLIGSFELQDSLGGIIKTDMMTAGISGTDNAEIYYDNFIVSEVWEKPAIVSVEPVTESDGKAIDIKLDSAVPAEIKDIISSIDLIAGDNKIIIEKYELGEDGKTIRLNSKNELPTSMNINCSIIFNNGDECSGEFILPPNDFDITNISFKRLPEGKRVTASIVNKTSEAKHIIMFAVLYGKDDEITGTVSAETDILPSSNETELICDTANTSEYIKVFFINSWEEGKVLKNAVYSSNG